MGGLMGGPKFELIGFLDFGLSTSARSSEGPRGRLFVAPWRYYLIPITK
jgi:hypothetical protein